jgi:hypothetical protein
MTLVGYWPLNEASSNSAGTAYDYAGDNVGVITGAGPAGTGTVSGPIGQSAYKFDGSDDYVSSSTSFSFAGKDHSVSVWFNTPRTTGSNNSYQALYNWNKSYAGLWTRNNSINYFSGDGSGAIVTGGTYSTDVWNHAVAIRRENVHKLFLNGVKVGEVSEAYSDSADVDHYIGNRYDATKPFKGGLAEVRVYSHALAASEVQYLYQVSQRGQLVSSKKSS